MTSDDRRQALLNLISARPPIEQSVSRLRAFPWDSEEAHVVLLRADAARVLRRYLKAELLAEQCVLWADAVEARDDIRLDPNHAEMLQQLIFELANPELEGVLTVAAARSWLRRLEGPEASAESDSEWVADEPEHFGDET